MIIRALATNAFWSLLSHVFSRGSLMLSAVLLARSFSPQDFATYSYFQLTISTLAAYAGMGLGVTASRYFAEVGNAQQSPQSVPLGTLWSLSILFAIITAFCIFFIPNSWLDAGFIVPKWLLATGVFILALQIVPNGAILGLEKYKQATYISAISGICMLCGTWYAIQSNSPIIAMIFIIIAIALQVLGESLIVLKTVGFNKILSSTKYNFISIRHIFNFAGPMLIVSLLAVSGTWLLGRLIIRNNGENAFVLYSIGMQWYALALVLPGMVSRVILPRIIRNTNSKNIDQKNLIRQGALLSVLIAIFIFLIGLLFSEKIIQIYGKQYYDNQWLIAGYLFAAILIAPANTIGNAIVASDGQHAWLLLTIMWILTLLSCGQLSNNYGAWAGAIAHGTAATVLTTMTVYLARSRKLI
jgi:O-antigen/teichoic acid export membrane protein